MNSPATPPRPELPSPGLTIRLLGDFALWYRGEPLPTVNTPRLQALLAYLLLHRQAPQSRRRLAFLFWPDSTEAQALTNLRKQILYLRQVLPDSDALLHMDRQSVRWAATTSLQLDVDTFRAALAEATTATNSHAIPALRQALASYGGELLPGCYDDWLLQLREALHAQRNQALEQISDLLEEQRNYAEAIRYAQQLLQDDPLHEATYRRLIRLYALKEDRAAALRLYHTCVTQLREELGVDPDGETQAVYERLIQGTPAGSAQPELAAYASFVGRQVEWQIIQQRWRIALRGQPQFVLIAGEAGIGKTRLAEELLNWASHQGFATVRSRCYAAEGRLPYAPIIEWLRAEPMRQQRDKVAATWVTELARLLPELLTEQPTVPQPAPITQSWQRHHLFEAATRTLLARNQPLILLLDDLQWCDKETLELLHFLLRNARTFTQSPLLLVGTARLPDEVDATHPLTELLNALRGNDTLTQLDLARLTAAETGELANTINGQSLNSAAISQLYADTEGNPLFVVEMVRANLQSQVQVTAVHPSENLPAGRVSHTGAGSILPARVYSVIQARLMQLSPAAQEVAELAAVIGRQFSLDVLLLAAGKAEEVVIAALDELWQRHIVREQGVNGYDFSHDKLREVVYVESRSARRRLLHRRVAEALERIYAQQRETMAAQLAFHFEQASQVEQASAYYLQAGQAAQRVYAYREAIEHLERATTLLSMLPPSVSRDQQELDILMAMVIPLLVLSAYTSEQLYNVYERIRKLSEKLEHPPYPPVLRALAVHYLLRYRDFAQVQAWGEQILAMADQAPFTLDPILYVEANYVLGVNAFWQGQFVEAKTSLQRAVDAYAVERHHQHALLYGHDPGVYCMVRLAWDLWYLGYPDQARQRCHAALALAQQLAHPWSLQMVLMFVTWLYCDCRDVDNVVISYGALQVAHDTLNVESTARYQMFEGWYLVQSGQRQAGIARLYDHIAARQATNSGALYSPYIYTIIVEAYCLEGAYADARIAMEEAFAHLNGSQNYWYLAEMYRHKGEVLARLGSNQTAIEVCFQQALDLARQQQAKSLELRAVMSLSRLWQQQGKTKEAYALLADIYGWFTEGFDTPDLQEAKALLAQLLGSTT